MGWAQAALGVKSLGKDQIVSPEPLEVASLSRLSSWPLRADLGLEANTEQVYSHS